MLNKILHTSLMNRVVVLIIAALIMVAGVITLTRTEVDIFPDLNAPTVVVMTEARGYTPEEVERIISYPLETAVNGATGVRRVTSSSMTGFSIVKVEFDWGTDIYQARQTVTERIAAVAEDLPKGIGVPTLGPQSSILGEMMIIGLTSDKVSQADLRTIADRTLRPRLLSIGGVSQVAVIGGEVVEYQILLNPSQMRQKGVTLDMVREAVDSYNNNASGGVIYEYGNEYLVKGDIATTSIEDLAAVVVKGDGETPIMLNDVARVEIGNQSPKLGVASEKAHPAVLVTVTKQPGVGTVQLTSAIEDELESIKTSIPAGINISTDIFRQSNFINTSISNLQESLLEGALFVVIVLFFFLMNLRTTLISVVALPLSILVTVLVLAFCGISINTMTLGGIAIAIGSLVDDAIVDVENVYKRLRENNSLPEAERRPALKVVYEASKEVRVPIFNSTLIIMASFLPLFFLSGMEGRMLIPLGISFIIALIASTIVALTLTPVLCYYLLGGKKVNKMMSCEPWMIKKLKGAYITGLRFAFKGKWVLLSVVGALLVWAVLLFLSLGRSFLPTFNEGSFTINIGTLPGISLEESDRLGREAEKIIMSVPEITTVARKTGRAELDEHSFGVNVSELEAPYHSEGRSRREIAAELREKLGKLPGVNIEIGQPVSHRIDAMLSGTQSQIAIKLFGDDLETLYKIGSKIKGEIAEVPGIVDANVEQQVNRPQLDIRPRRQMLARYGIPVSKFAEYINTAIGSEVVSQVYVDGLPFDITLKVDDDYKDTADKIRDLLIDSNQGMIPLSYVADVEVANGPATINRENVSRRIVVSANVEGRDLRGAVNDIQDRINERVKLPEKYYLVYGGQFENEKAASRTLGITTGIALLVILMLLYGEFHNMTQSLIILLNMPLAAIGGVFILWLTSGELNIPAIIGFISLIGITTRNGMLLMSRYNALKQEGVGLMERIRIGSADRLSPIIMTALTSALALIPLALRGSEPGNEIQSPMAIVILGGLLTSTILNIFVVPIVYYLIERRKSKGYNQDHITTGRPS